MAPLTKETLEVTNLATEPTVAPVSTPSKPASGHMRADAVSLEVAVSVHGSRVTQVAGDVTPHTEPFEEQTSTMIVFPQGGVLRMSTSANVGQMLVVTNVKTRQDAICRVVKVRAYSASQSYIEVEFTHPQPGYWGVYFPSDGPAPANKFESSSAPAISEPEPKESEKQFSDVSWAPAPSALPAVAPEATGISTESKPRSAPPAVLKSPSKQAPSFISIGSQEDVQPAASAMATTQAAPPLEWQREARAPEEPKPAAIIDFPAAPPAAPPPALSMNELRGDEVSSALRPSPAAETPENEYEGGSAAPGPMSESTRAVFGNFASAATFESSHAEVFGERLNLESESPLSKSEASNQNWILIAACVTVLFAGLAAGLFYFRHQSTHIAVAIPSSTPAAEAAPINTQPATGFNAAVQPSAEPSSKPLVSAANGVASSGNVNIGKPAKPADSLQVASLAPAKQVAPSVTTDMMSSALNAHPTRSQGDDSLGGAAPQLVTDPSAGDNSMLPGIAGTPNSASPPPPEIRPEGPVTIGGNVKEPKLISSVLPVYPKLASQAGVQGDVIVKTTISAQGNVVQMHVVSGPPMLRQAALDALRRWEYEPSKLNGQPVSVEMMVTIKFRR